MIIKGKMEIVRLTVYDVKICELAVDPLSLKSQLGQRHLTLPSKLLLIIILEIRTDIKELGEGGEGRM